MFNRNPLNFAVKMAITFATIGLIVSIPILYYFYNISYQLVLSSLQSRIKDLGRAGLFLFSDKEFAYLKKLDQEMNQKIKNLPSENLKEIKQIEAGGTYEILSDNEHEEIYTSKEYQNIVQILRKIKAFSSPKPLILNFYEQKFYESNNRPFVRYVYILTPISEFPDHHYVKLLVDSDMEEVDENGNGKIDEDETFTQVSTIYNVSFTKFIPNTFKSKEIQCENEFYQDQWGILLSCYLPILDKNLEVVGILGLDLDVFSENNKLNNLKKNLTILLIILTAGIAFFSYTFAKLISRPIISLSKASIEVSNKNFQIELPIPSKDEIGILTKNFNSMVKEIKEYSEHLEDLVAKRTKQLQESLETIQKLKTLQDGDYFLMSLLIDPLIKNLNKSSLIKTDILIKQKKEFEFKGKKREIGGDLCITGNLRFQNKDKEIERWLFFFNGDAMGKSSQGAGGVLVMGSLLNAILTRSAAKDKVLNMEPIQWLKGICFEIQRVFLKFDGHMLISGGMGILSENTGQMLYANFEHPKAILYRNQKANFIEESTDFFNYKFGFPITNKLKILSFYLQKEDILILGSDGREDIILKESNEMNFDEAYILPIVEEAKGDLSKIFDLILQKGELTDDISLLKIHYLPSGLSGTGKKENLQAQNIKK
ncbi:MAG: SpoIIE family protein phosphatase [Leptonema sp. (in: bacteria)]